ncbi:MAG: hypothetical protein FIA97_00795, partial [Methylococcaceae bacterium]|nr:hypothetical protein [Methylococcaceae bacterium]
MLEYRRLAFAAVAFAMIVAAYCDSGPRAEATSQQSPAVCEDTQPPEPLKPYDETLPFHAHLAEWLAEHPQLQQIECQSKQFIYRAKRQQSQLSVESLYKDGSRRHAEYLAQQEPTIGSGFRRHGVIRSLWPNGNSQSVEYYCHGLPVGFHQYFDDAGNLSHVVDYSGSDYEWRKRLLGHEVRAYYDGENRHWNGIQPSRQTGLFREAYAIEGGKAVRKAFATAQVFNPPWFPLDLSTTIAQWTNPGDQGLVTVGSRQLRLVNEDLEYLSFAEVYQRHKRGLPGLRPPAAFHTEILACPWIDEAMRLGVEDARFQMPPVAAIDEQTRKNSPEARFAACLNSPTADCLFEHALKNLRFDRGQMDGYAKSAILAGHPEWARKAANEVLGKTQGFTLPNAIFGPAAAYKAQAEFALGLRQEAEKSLDEAYQHAVSELGGTSSAHKIPAILAVTPVMARQLRVEETRRLYERAVVYEVATALIIPEALALDLIRQGRVDEAEKIEQEFFADSASDARIPTIKSGSDFKPVDDSRQHVLAMIELAKVRVKRGDIAGAKDILGEIDKLIAGRQLAMGEVAGLGLLYARLGDSRKVSQLTESPYSTDLQVLADIAVTLCNRGQMADGLQLLERLHLEKLTAAKVLIARAWVESACGKEEQAKMTIALARQDWKGGFPCCAGDLCNRVGERDLWREWQSRIDAGKTAACSRGEFMGGWSLFFQRLLDQANHGEPAKALAELDAMGPIYIESKKYLQGYEHARPYERSFPLIRAQLLTLTGRSEEARSELVRA